MLYKNDVFDGFCIQMQYPNLYQIDLHDKGK